MSKMSDLVVEQKDGAPRRILGPTDMGAANRARVLQLLHRTGPSTRADISRALNVNRATVASIIQPLLEQGLLTPKGSSTPTSAGGKPGTKLWFNDRGPQLGAILIDMHVVVAARVNIDGTIVAQRTEPIQLDGGVNWTAVLTSLMHEVFENEDVLGIGVAAPGMIDVPSGRILVVYRAPMLRDFPLGDILRNEFGGPVIVDHHPRVQALGDFWFGRGKSRRSFASVYAGSVLGIGLVIDEELFEGPGGAGGEAGHTIVDMNGAVCVCGRKGCWETIATTHWLEEEAARRYLVFDGPIVSGLSQLEAAGDVEASGLLDTYAQNLAVGMANNEQVVASGTYLVHGDVCQGGSSMEQRLRRWLVEMSPVRNSPEVVFAAEPLDDNTTLLGGAGLVLSRVFANLV